MPTRSRVVAAAAQARAGIGAGRVVRWSGRLSVEYPRSSTRRARPSQSPADRAVQTFTPNRKGFIDTRPPTYTARSKWYSRL